MSSSEGWQAEAGAAFTVEARLAAAALAASLKRSELSRLGAVLARLPACAIYSTLTLPPPQRSRYSPGLAYLIQWIYALDALMDTCPTVAYANDLLRLVTLLPTSASTAFTAIKPAFATNPGQPLPHLGYSLLTLVETLQPLRHWLRALASDWAGPEGFDRYLLRVLAAMQCEADWRLKRAQPSFDEYMAVASVSICGGLCLWTIIAGLPNPEACWNAARPAAALADYGARLANDLATRKRDEAEGKPNAVALLARSYGSLAAAERQVRARIRRTAARLGKLTGAGAPTPEPRSTLNYYIYYSLVIARFMYQKADFDVNGGSL